MHQIDPGMKFCLTGLETKMNLLINIFQAFFITKIKLPETSQLAKNVGGYCTDRRRLKITTYMMNLIKNGLFNTDSELLKNFLCFENILKIFLSIKRPVSALSNKNSNLSWPQDELIKKTDWVKKLNSIETYKVLCNPREDVIGDANYKKTKSATDLYLFVAANFFITNSTVRHGRKPSTTITDSSIKKRRRRRARRRYKWKRKPKESPVRKSIKKRKRRQRKTKKPPL